MKWNEPGRQTCGRYTTPVSRHSMQSYSLTYYRLRKREPWGALNSASAVPHLGGGGGGGADLTTLALRSWPLTA